MKKYLTILVGSLLIFTSCEKNGIEGLETPSNIAGAVVKPLVGGALIKWEVPTDSNFLYLEVRYKKNGQDKKVKVSKFTDSLVVQDLLNKNQYQFELQTFHANQEQQLSGNTITTEPVRPIRRPIVIKYFPDAITTITGVTADKLETYTQESTEGPKSNLVDGNISTYWHSAWSTNVAPLPHWISYHNPEKIKMGGIEYYFRQNTDNNGRPNQFALEVSENGTTWERVWTSKADLATTPVDKKQTLNFDKNYEATYFRIMILKTPGMTSYTHLSEISFFSMKEETVDAEAAAEIEQEG